MDKIKVLLMAVYNENMMRIFEEIGICCIASFLRENGYEVMLLGADEGAVDYEKIVSFKPDLVGLPVYDISKKSVYRVCNKIRKCIPSTNICVGGCLPTYFGEEMLKEELCIDYAIRGEGELVMLELVSRLSKGEGLNGVKGLTYRHNGEIIVNKDQELIEDISVLPLPARDLLMESKSEIAIMSTSRGCTAKCSFCASQLFWKKWRGRSVERILDEIEYVIKGCGVNKFNFIDGSFEDPGINCARVQQIAEGIIERQLNISYFADFRAEFHKKAKSELMELLKRSGLCGVCVGIESANEFDLRLYGKNATLDDNTAIIKLFQEHGINVDPGFINFNPYSSFQGLHKNIDFLEKYGFASSIDCVLSRYKMYKGTSFYSEIANSILLKQGDFDDGLGYTFEDKRIERLYDYLNNYVTKVNAETGNVFKGAVYYTFKYQTFLDYFKREYSNKNKEIYSTVINSEKKSTELCFGINSHISAWFRQLLDLAEKGWDCEVADLISQENLSCLYMWENIKKLDLAKNKLYFKLDNLGVDPYLLSIN